jgi:alpha-1,6-mannosyltransferase
MRQRLVYIGLAAIYLFAILFISFTPRQEFELLLIGLFIAFAVWYLFLVKEPKLMFVLVLALLARLSFFLALPLLSDDFYRFIWDGQLFLEGLNPIGKIPTEISLDLPNEGTLLEQMNSRDYPSVYPPLHQIGMAFGALFDNFLTQVNGMRVFIILCEALALGYFWRYSKTLLGLYCLYLLNPLVIVEGVGNVHFEAALLPFLAIAIDQARQSKANGASVSFGLAVLLKLNPLILVPAFFKEEKGMRIVAITGLVVLLGFAPFIGGVVDSFGGIGLFFRNFEFNASIYYVLSEIGQAALGYNPISILGPALGVVGALLILAVGFSQAELKEKALLIYLIFLLFSSTVHPWYIIPVAYLSLLTDRKAILIWSFTAFFSYSHYLGELEPKYSWLIGEYVLLFLAIIYEYRRRPIQLFRG